MKVGIDLDGLVSFLFGLLFLEEKLELDLGIFGNFGFFYNFLDIEVVVVLLML